MVVHEGMKLDSVRRRCNEAMSESRNSGKRCTQSGLEDETNPESVYQF